MYTTERVIHPRMRSLESRNFIQQGRAITKSIVYCIELMCFFLTLQKRIYHAAQSDMSVPVFETAFSANG